MARPERFWFNHLEMKDVKRTPPKRAPGQDYDSKLFMRPDKSAFGSFRFYDDGRIEKTVFPLGAPSVTVMTDKDDPDIAYIPLAYVNGAP